MVVPSVGHIEASMVPMPVSLTDPNSDAADPDIGAFRDEPIQQRRADKPRSARHQDRHETSVKAVFSREAESRPLHSTIFWILSPVVRR